MGPLQRECVPVITCSLGVNCHLTTMTSIATYWWIMRSAQKQGIVLYEFHSSYDARTVWTQKELRQISITFNSFVALSEGDAPSLSG